MSKVGVAGVSILLSLATLASLRATGQSGAARRAAPPMARYTDPDGDVSFDYPVVWKVDKSPQFYIPPLILMSDRNPRVQVVFSPGGNLYEKTTLHGLVFAYVKMPQPSPEACAAMAVSPTRDKEKTVVINGVSFEHFEMEDAAMCHGVKQEIFRTYRGGVCYLFEGDMDTTCLGAVDGQRELTGTETRALMRHLNAIPQSILFSPGK
jgi:hypothetical protein